MPCKIKLNNAGFDYGERPIFNGLNFEIQKGTIVSRPVYDAYLGFNAYCCKYFMRKRTS